MRMTKGEQREKIKKNQSKMIVSNRSIFTIDRIKRDRAKKNIEN